MLLSCTDSYMGVEQVKTDSTKPGKVVVNQVVSKPGALEIHFELPKGNENIAHVEASYINKQGKKMEFSVSRYTSTILVEGFTGTDEVTVELVCVDNSGNVSDITLVKDSPLTSTVEIAFNSLKISPTFGGIKVDWKNDAGNHLAFHVLVEDSLDKYEMVLEEDPNQVIYSSDSLLTYAFVRPFEHREQKFGITVSDKWGNRTDTLITSLIPYKEERIPYDKVTDLNWFNYSYHNNSRDYHTHGVDPITGLQNDGNYHGTSYGVSTIFNNNLISRGYYIYKFIKNLSDGDASTNEMVHTVYSSMNLNVDCRLNRFKLYQRTHESYWYNRSSPKRFRIWGTDDSKPNAAVDFPGSWTLIGEYVGREPEDRNNLTQEEIEYFLEHNEFLVEEDNVNPDANPTASFRYMRIEWMESYDKNIPYYTLAEFVMYGEVLKKY